MQSEETESGQDFVVVADEAAKEEATTAGEEASTAAEEAPTAAEEATMEEKEAPTAEKGTATNEGGEVWKVWRESKEWLKESKERRVKVALWTILCVSLGAGLALAAVRATGAKPATGATPEPAKEELAWRAQRQVERLRLNRELAIWDEQLSRLFDLGRSLQVIAQPRPIDLFQLMPRQHYHISTIVDDCHWGCQERQARREDDARRGPDGQVRPEHREDRTPREAPQHEDTAGPPERQDDQPGLSDRDKLRKLTTKQLRNYLAKHNVDCPHCVEKDHLVDRALRFRHARTAAAT